jgi:hypothetical protein
MIDISSETLLPLREAARLIPSHRRGVPVSYTCLWRWAARGVKGPDGTTVRLETVKLGTRTLTSKEALARWAQRLTPRANDTPATPPRTARQQRAAAARAERELSKLGV